MSRTEAIFSAVQGKPTRKNFALNLIFPFPVGSKADLPELLKCHALQSQVLHKYNLQLARTSDAVAHTYASVGMLVFCVAAMVIVRLQTYVCGDF